jgi:hypothetical protein
LERVNTKVFLSLRSSSRSGSSWNVYGRRSKLFFGDPYLLYLLGFGTLMGAVGVFFALKERRASGRSSDERAGKRHA